MSWRYLILNLIVSYAAASILLAATLSPGSSVDLETEPYITSWRKALEILKCNKVQLQASAQAVRILENCRARLRSVSEPFTGMSSVL